MSDIFLNPPTEKIKVTNVSDHNKPVNLNMVVKIHRGLFPDSEMSPFLEFIMPSSETIIWLFKSEYERDKVLEAIYKEYGFRLTGL